MPVIGGHQQLIYESSTMMGANKPTDASVTISELLTAYYAAYYFGKYDTAEGRTMK